MEIRTPDHKITTSILDSLGKQIEKIETTRGVRIERSLLLDQAAVALDETVMEAMSRAMKTMPEPYVTLTSMAGHDATHLASITRSGMLFVRSIDGKSHCPQENSEREDIEKAGTALLKTILLLDKELDSDETYL